MKIKPDDCAFGHAADNGHCKGLTKREEIALRFMTAKLSNPLFEQYIRDAFPDKRTENITAAIVRESIKAANIFIEEFNEENPNE